MFTTRLGISSKYEYNISVDADTQQIGISRSSRVFFVLFFLAICTSIGLTYYHAIIREDYVVFTDSSAVPDPADFFAYLVSAIEPYFQK